MVQQSELVAEVKKRLQDLDNSTAANEASPGLSAGLEKVKVQDRDDVPSEAPVIPTVT